MFVDQPTLNNVYKAELCQDVNKNISSSLIFIYLPSSAAVTLRMTNTWPASIPREAFVKF